MPRQTPAGAPQEPQEAPEDTAGTADTPAPSEPLSGPHTGDPVPGVSGGFYLNHDELAGRTFFPESDPVAEGRRRADALDALYESDDHPLTVWEAVAEITRQVDPIAKDRQATEGGSYKYRGIDDVFAAVHPLLGEIGLLILPGEVVDSRWETRATAKGGTLNVARLRIRYTLVGPDGSTLIGEAWGEGGDSGDKATQKAHSQSYKTFVLQLFSIPTEDSRADEPDATNPAARPFTAEEVQRAGTAAHALEEAESVEALAGIRRRALPLLDVPVPLEDGSVAPLTVLFDRKLAALDRSAGGEQR